MINNFKRSTKLNSNKYVEFHSFDNLYEEFEKVVKNHDYKLNNSKYLICDKYLLASIIGCIEGNIQIDIDNNSWYIWFGQYHAGYKVDNDNKFPYIMLSIYEFIKSHEEYYNFMTRYYDLWHNVPKFDNLEFIYDEYHILDMNDNCEQLINIIYKDNKSASERLDNNVVVSYEVLYDFLSNMFFSEETLNWNEYTL